MIRPLNLVLNQIIADPTSGTEATILKTRLPVTISVRAALFGGVDKLFLAHYAKKMKSIFLNVSLIMKSATTLDTNSTLCCYYFGEGLFVGEQMWKILPSFAKMHCIDKTVEIFYITLITTLARLGLPLRGNDQILGSIYATVGTAVCIDHFNLSQSFGLKRYLKAASKRFSFRPAEFMKNVSPDIVGIESIFEVISKLGYPNLLTYETFKGYIARTFTSYALPAFFPKDSAMKTALVLYDLPFSLMLGLCNTQRVKNNIVGNHLERVAPQIVSFFQDKIVDYSLRQFSSG